MLKENERFELFENGTRIFFIGIGGVSMSSVALALKAKGCRVSGYDSTPSELTELLTKKGVRVSYEYDPSDFDGVDAVVYTNAIKETDPVFVRPVSLGIPMFTRAQALGYLMKGYPNAVGVAGTHGKSTTTGMISQIFIAADRDPAVFAGAALPLIGGNYRLADSKDFIFEACEYKDSFLSFFPTVAVVLNVGFDHADYFRDLDDVVDSFNQYVMLTEDNGSAVVNADDPDALRAVLGYKGSLVTFSRKDPSADFFAGDISDEKGFYSFDLVHKGKKLVRVKLGVPGIFNVSNALAAAAASVVCGVEPEAVGVGLSSFSGMKRRFEIRGRMGDAVVVDDYAHHPDEIRATLGAARDMGFDRITVIFQSHTFSRTKACWDDIVSAFENGCDEVIYDDIYPARERPIEGVDARRLALCTKNGSYQGGRDGIVAYLKKKKPGGLIIVMGAGDIVELTPRLLEEVR